MTGLGNTIADKREECARELSGSALLPVVEKLRAYGICESMLRSVVASANREQAMLALAAQLGQGPEQDGAGTFDLPRALLAGVAMQNLDKLPDLPVEESVKSMLCDYCKFFMSPSPGEIPLFDPKQYSFLALAKIALLERFPAGQFDWEVTGFPRSWLFKIPFASLPGVLYFLARKLKGFAPCIMPHVAYRRESPLTRDCEKTWYRMALSVERQPKILGMVGCSWIFSPDTFKASPRFSLFVEPALESGGLVTRRGKVHGNAFMAGSETRRKLYESGEFKPTMGVFLWSRDQMIQWAHSHPEFGDR
ncbi:MAG: hypothetical protein ABSD64_07675 [Terriglobales bacterium]|jgi:hypothetical protein